jgi:hypothetical protein
VTGIVVLHDNSRLFVQGVILGNWTETGKFQSERIDVTPELNAVGAASTFAPPTESSF